MITILAAISVLLGATCCNAEHPSAKLHPYFNPYMELNRVLDDAAVIVDGRFVRFSTAKVYEYMDSDRFEELNATVPDLGIVANSAINLISGETCSSDNVESLRRIAEIGVKYDAKAFNGDKNNNRSLNFLVSDNIRRSWNEVDCVMEFKDYWTESGLDEEFEQTTTFDWLDAVNRRAFFLPAKHPFKLAVQKLIRASKRAPRALSKSQLAHLVSSLRRTGETANFQQMESFFDEYVSKPCTEFTKRNDVRLALKRTVDFSVALKLTNNKIHAEDEPQLYKWASRYIMCELINKMDKKTLVRNMLRAYRP